MLRNFDAERNSVDARGTGPAQFDQYYAGISTEERPQWLAGLDGRHVPEWDMHHPAAEHIAPKATPENRERVRKHNEELHKRGAVTCTCTEPSQAKRPI